MRILLTGSEGQLGYYLQKTLKIYKYDIYLTNSNSMDITDIDKTYQTITSIKPDVVIHTAASTNVELCENCPEMAYRVNAIGTRNVAAACNAIGAKLAYLSTDFVFDGAKSEPYTEFDAPNAINVYGKSKLAGEEYVKSLINRYFIIRTSWLYGYHGKNFLKTIVNLANKNGVLEVVNDQTGTPTFAGDLANIIGEIIITDNYGIYHCSNEGACSWFDFARKILECASIDGVELKPISTEMLSQKAQRPKYSVLENYMLELQKMPRMLHWQYALKSFFDRGIAVDRKGHGLIHD